MWSVGRVLLVVILPRRVVLTRATGRDAGFFEAGLDRYRLVDTLIHQRHGHRASAGMCAY